MPHSLPTGDDEGQGEDEGDCDGDTGVKADGIGTSVGGRVIRKKGRK